MKRGFSLIELAISMAIASVVATAAIGTFSIVNRQIVQLRTESAVETKLQRVLGGVIGDLQEVGGGAIRPWHALFVRPGDSGTRGSDGVLSLTVDLQWPGVACPVVSYDGAVLIAGNVPNVPPAAPGMHCCLTDGAIRGRFGVVTLGADAVAIGIGSTVTAPCSANALPLFAPERSDPAHDFELGTMTFVDAKWLTVDHTEHELVAYMLQCGSAVADPPGALPPSVPLAMIDVKSRRTLARDIYDFQVANGHDMNLDGAVSETVGGAADEWIGNTGAEGSGENWLGDQISETGANFLMTRYRMVEIGFIVGLPSKMEKGRADVTVLNGPIYTSTGPTFSSAGLYMRSGKARVLLRNSGLYE